MPDDLIGGLTVIAGPTPDARRRVGVVGGDLGIAPDVNTVPDEQDTLAPHSHAGLFEVVGSVALGLTVFGGLGTISQPNQGCAVFNVHLFCVEMGYLDDVRRSKTRAPPRPYPPRLDRKTTLACLRNLNHE